MEQNIYVILGISILVLIPIFVIEDKIICTYYLAKLAERYKYGIDIGCNTLIELREKLIDVIGQDVVIMGNHVIAGDGSTKYVFSIENGKVIVEYPDYSKGHLKIFKLKKAISTSMIMDKIAAKYNPEFQTEEPRTYVKAGRVFKRTAFVLVLYVLIVGSSLVWIVSNNSSKMIDIVKNSSPTEYPNYTYGKAFDTFFDETKWEFFTSDGKNNSFFDSLFDRGLEIVGLKKKNRNLFKVVKFTGKEYSDASEIELVVSFTIDDNDKNVGIRSVKFNGKKSENDILRIIFDIVSKDVKEKNNMTEKGEVKKKSKKEKQKKVENNQKSEKKKEKTTTRTIRYRYSDDELVGAAMEYYHAVNGPDRISAMLDGEDGDNIKIRIFVNGADAIATLAWYTVNVYTGKGTDFWGDPIDIMNPPTTTTKNYSNDEYIFPYSDSQYLTDSDLWSMSSDELRIARNEIYARHGRMFKDQTLQNYFNSKSWYIPSVRPEDFNEHWLNEYEKANAQLIKSFE